MTSAEHPFTPEDVQAWVDGEFGGEPAAALEAHLVSCAECTGLAASIRATSSAMRQWRIEPAPSSVRAQAQPHRYAWVMWAAPAAAALLATALVVWPASKAPQEMAASLEGDGRGDFRVALGNSSQVPLASAGPIPAQEESASVRRMSAMGLQGQQGQGQGQGQGQAAGGRQAMVVRTATLSLLVADIEKARTSLDSMVNSVSGFVGQMDTSGGRGEARWLTTTLRVPEQRLSEVIAGLKKLGAVQAESQGGEDVTSQATDLDARLANARETEKRLVTVLQQRTGKVADVLEVEREIARVRESIELMTSQREQLKDRVMYATISLRVTEETKASLDLGAPSILGRFRNALVEGTTAATEAVLAMTLFLVRLAPSAILLTLALGWPVRVVFRRLRISRT